jgi:hypothetical protein
MRILIPVQLTIPKQIRIQGTKPTRIQILVRLKSHKMSILEEKFT